MKHGVLVTTGALVGGSRSASATGPPEGTATTDSTTARGVMFPYQFTPNARFRLLETDLEWRPRGIDPAYSGHVIEYEHARSLRAFFFTDAGLPSNREATYEFGNSSRASPVSTDRCLVGVTAEFDGR